ncbi:MAG TPA: hypothetical protein VMT19_03910 [Thermoanaerobaculaceae bacterium]|nr:hypothetical protein [Thermoanaerobaculaceae bacterium]
MPTYLNRPRRATAFVSTALALFGAADATLHVHAGGTLEAEASAYSRVSVAIVADPDGPSQAVHLHSGSTVPSEPCPACVLSRAHGVIVPLIVAPPAADVVTLEPPVPATVATSPAASTGSRSPPACA